MEKVAREVETALKTVPGTSSAYAERVVGGYYLEIVPDRDQLARYGLMVSDVQDVVATALGRRTHHHHRRGPRTLHGRHPLSARSALRSAGHRQGRAGVAAERRHGAAWARWPTSSSRKVPTSIRTENAKLATYIFVDIRDRDLGGYVADAQKGGGRAGEAAGRHLPGVERPVRIPRTRRGPPADGGAGDADDHLPAALPQLPAPHRDAHRHAVAAVRAGRRALADVVARVQPVGGGGGRVHRAGRRRRRDRRGDADLSRPCGRGGQRTVRSRRAGLLRAQISTKPS